MGMTLSEKILAKHCGKSSVNAGDLVNVKVDMVMANDVTAPIAIREFNKLGLNKVFDPKRVAIVLSHFVPNKDIEAGAQAKTSRDFAREQGILFFDEGHGGIEHILLPQEGLVVPGDVYIGADSHTPTPGALTAFTCGMGSTDIAVGMATGEIWMKVPSTLRFIYHGKIGPWIRSKDLILYTIGQIGTDGATYSTMQFEGEVINTLSMDARFTMCNMVAEAGGKNGIIPFDETVNQYVTPKAKRPWEVFTADDDAVYEKTFEWDVSDLEPQIAFPFSPDNTKPISEAVSKNISVDQVFIGSCTNARLEDLREAASILKGHKVSPWVRCIVIPATMEVYRACLKEGLAEIFNEANCVFSTPTCGPCLGGFMGVVAKGEKCLSTSNRNFPGRMGHPEGEVFLSNPSVAAATAITGRITHPEEIISADSVLSAMKGS